MTGRVTIWYNWGYPTSAARSGDEELCEAYLEWTPTLPSATDKGEMICKRGATFEEARAKVIEAFKKLPPSESIVIEEEA